MNYHKSDIRNILIWLFLVGILALFTVILGGYTRLTGSGLSITEWKPVTGLFLPLTDHAWSVEFNKYKISPEYIQINFDMNLNEFKRIFLIEYIHRILARSIFIIFVIPGFFFIFLKKIKIDKYLVIIFLAILLQGFIGWYMVKSGLINKPHVSHYRLAIHFILALFLCNVIFFRFLYYKDLYLAKKILLKRNKISQNIFIIFIVFYFLFLVQVILGCFVAGLKAGLIYNSYPMMGDGIIPTEINFSIIKISQIFSDAVYIQFFHRIMAMLLIICSFFFSLYSFFFIKNKNFRFCMNLLFITILIQFFVGVLTLLFSIPVALALFHQIWALMISFMYVYIFYLFFFIYNNGQI
ncbi:MAG: COX15/CtaA family protein [Rickettsia sp.]|nr:COX15/CtaA family protein [Rickettsia sp.]